jgi:hypothetical protein
MTATLGDAENGKRVQRSAEQLAAAELLRLAKEQDLLSQRVAALDDRRPRRIHGYRTWLRATSV